MAAKSIEMTVKKWISIPDHPRQRNTEARARTAAQRHLKTFKPPHAFVDAVVFKGTMYKLNGHTRSFLWEQGKLEPPPDGKIRVSIVETSKEEEFLNLYDMYDSQAAVKRSHDSLFGAVQQAGLQLTSPLLARFGFTTQLRRAANDMTSKKTIYVIVDAWKPELEALDRMQLSRGVPFLVTIALIAIRRDGEESARGFFKGIDTNKGTKDKDKGSDGIQAAVEFLKEKRAAKATAGYPNWNEIDKKVWSAYEQYKRKDFISRPLRESPKLDSIIRGVSP
jgi:hypothetical protein